MHMSILFFFCFFFYIYFTIVYYILYTPSLVIISNNNNISSSDRVRRVKMYDTYVPLICLIIYCLEISFYYYNYIIILPGAPEHQTYFVYSVGISHGCNILLRVLSVPIYSQFRLPIHNKYYKIVMIACIIIYYSS